MSSKEDYDMLIKREVRTPTVWMPLALSLEMSVAPIPGKSENGKRGK
jgi:hypothetical protein